MAAAVITRRSSSRLISRRPGDKVITIPFTTQLHRSCDCCYLLKPLIYVRRTACRLDIFMGEPIRPPRWVAAFRIIVWAIVTVFLSIMLSPGIILMSILILIACLPCLANAVYRYMVRRHTTPEPEKSCQRILLEPHRVVYMRFNQYLLQPKPGEPAGDVETGELPADEAPGVTVKMQLDRAIYLSRRVAKLVSRRTRVPSGSEGGGDVEVDEWSLCVAGVKLEGYTFQGPPGRHPAEVADGQALKDLQLMINEFVAEMDRAMDDYARRGIGGLLEVLRDPALMQREHLLVVNAIRKLLDAIVGANVRGLRQAPEVRMPPKLADDEGQLLQPALEDGPKSAATTPMPEGVSAAGDDPLTVPNDLVVFVLEGGHESYKSRNRMMAASEVFKAMLGGDFQEVGVLGRVEIPNIRLPVWSAMMHFIDTRQLPTLYTDSADGATPFELLQVADQYLVQDLKEACEYYIIDNYINDSTTSQILLDVLESSQQLSAQRLGRHCLKHVLQRYDSVYRLAKMAEGGELLFFDSLYRLMLLIHTSA